MSKKQPSKDYKKELLKRLKDPEYAAEYLNAAIEDGSKEVFLLALRDVCESRGMSKTAQKTKLNREHLYRILSPKGNPQLETLNTIMGSFNLRFHVETL